MVYRDAGGARLLLFGRPIDVGHARDEPGPANRVHRRDPGDFPLEPSSVVLPSVAILAADAMPRAVFHDRLESIEIGPSDIGSHVDREAAERLAHAAFLQPRFAGVETQIF